MKFKVRVDSQTFEVEIESVRAVPVIAIVDGQRFEVWPEDAASHTTAPALPPKDTPIVPPRSSASAHSNVNGRGVYAPIPGVIIGTSVQAGDVVSIGQELCVLEAMKMKQSIRSARAGQIAAVHVSAGQTVKHHALLVEFSDDEE